MADLPLLDTNPILRHALDDHPDHSPRSHALFARVEQGQVRLRLPGKRAYRQVFDLWVSQPRLSFADCYHVVFVQRHKLAAIVTFDQDFDRVPGLTRREP